jgi:hypothetical protein
LLDVYDDVDDDDDDDDDVSQEESDFLPCTTCDVYES